MLANMSEWRNGSGLGYLDRTKGAGPRQRGISRAALCISRPDGKPGAWYHLETMETLWAPWRIGYVMAEKPQGCVFCTKPAENRDSENFILYRGALCFAVLNIYPYNNGHLMVVPYQHVPSIELLPPETASEMMAVAQKAVGVLRLAMHPGGFNIGINQGASAGAGIVDHVHLHVVPRWVGDTNFMPVIGETRVMPQALESCYELLSRGFQQLPDNASRG